MATKVLSDYLKDGFSTSQISDLFLEVNDSKFQTEPAEARKKAQRLFMIGLGNINTLFPKVGTKSSSTDPRDYIERWLKRYYKAHKKRPSLAHANPKGSAADPSLAVMVKEAEAYSTEQIDLAIKHHNLFLAAENVQGSLLEEYISLKTENLGWIWAEGETMRACDFVRQNEGEPFPRYVQIKNRDNTENSSSSAIREGTQIQKWNRLKTRKKKGVPYATFNWSELNKLMLVPEGAQMSEEDYESFLSKVARNNPNLLEP